MPTTTAPPPGLGLGPGAGPGVDRVVELVGCGEEELLARATAVAETQRRAAVELLVIAYEWAVVHPRTRLDPSEAARPGREQAVRYGGEGTPEVTEFAAATLGARIGRTTHAGRKLMAAALDLHHRLPLLWTRVQALEVRDSYAVHVAERTRDLSAAEAAHVDAAVAESADGRTPWTRFQVLLEGAIATAAPAVAREKEERARKATFAKTLQDSTGAAGEAGMASFLVRAPIPVITAFDAAVTTLAHRLAETLPDPAPGEEKLEMDQLRVMAVALLANPGAAPTGLDLRDLLPAATIYVHLYGGTADHAAGRDVAGADRDADDQPGTGGALDRIARVEGHGPVTETWLREVLGTHARLTVRPVLHPEAMAPVDAYEIPVRHREAVRLRSPADCFPHGSSTSRTMQVDHTVPYDRGGPTDPANLGQLTTLHHRLKTHGRWATAQPFPGIHLWRDPHGATYLVDTTGTRALPPEDPLALPDHPDQYYLDRDPGDPPWPDRDAA